ncbi:MAG: S9 family peptidase, partial [Candidatus Latescibacterota bacterium]
MIAPRTGTASKWLRLFAPLMALVVVAFWVAAVLPVQSETTETKTFEYPPAKKVDVVDDFHGTQVADPYRWLEDHESDETTAWVDAQNKITQHFIQDIPAREAIETRLTELWNYPRYSLPYKHGGRYFFYKNDGLQNQSVLYVQETLESDPKVVIDPNTLSEDGTIALTGTGYSEDGKYLAYALSKSGSDWQEVMIREIDTGEIFDEVLKWCKFSSLAWKHDNTGFYYNRFPEEGSVPEEDRNNFSKVYWHMLGTPQSEDVLIYEDPANKEYGFYPFVTDDGKYLGIGVYHGTDPKNGVYYREIESDGEFIKLIDLGIAEFNFIDNIGTTCYFNTDFEASKGRVITIDHEQPGQENWREVIPESDDVIHYVSMVDNKLIVAYMHHAHHKVKIFGTDGGFVRELELPTIGTVYGLSGRRTDTDMFFGLTSFLFPATAFRYDFKTETATVFRESEIDFDPSGYETKQVFYTSKDGTRVPMFITHKKGQQLDGNNPTILYGYGGF